MIELNYLGIGTATVVGMVLGALWYSPILFGNAWMKAIGKTPDTLGSSTWPMIGSIVANLMTAIGVGLLFSFIQVDSFLCAAAIGALLGGFIIFPAMWSNSLFCGWGNKLLCIQSGYRILTVILMSVVMYAL